MITSRTQSCYESEYGELYLMQLLLLYLMRLSSLVGSQGNSVLLLQKHLEGMNKSFSLLPSTFLYHNIMCSAYFGSW